MDIKRNYKILARNVLPSVHDKGGKLVHLQLPFFCFISDIVAPISVLIISYIHMCVHTFDDEVMK